MSQTSELISEDDCPESQATCSEKYTDDDSQCMDPDMYGPDDQELSCWHGDGGDLSWSDDTKAMWPKDGEIREDEEHLWCNGNHGDHAHREQSECQQWPRVSGCDDEIEIITNDDYAQYNQIDDVFYVDPVTARTLFSDLLLREERPTNLHIHVETRNKRQRFVARAVMVVSMTMFTVSVLLVIISLIMSDHIDDLVRSANTKLSTLPMATDMVTSFPGGFNVTNVTLHENG